MCILRRLAGLNVNGVNASLDAPSQIVSRADLGPIITSNRQRRSAHSDDLRLAVLALAHPTSPFVRPQSYFVFGRIKGFTSGLRAFSYFLIVQAETQACLSNSLVDDSLKAIVQILLDLYWHQSHEWSRPNCTARRTQPCPEGDIYQVPDAKHRKKSGAAKSAHAGKQVQARPEQPKMTKTDSVVALLRRPSGATLQAIMKLTGWQAHSVRGFLSAQLGKRKGLTVESTKRKGRRVYRIMS